MCTVVNKKRSNLFQTLSSCIYLKVVSEEPVFEAVMNWVRHDDEKRVEYLPNLLKYVRLPLLTAKYLTDQVDEEVKVLLCTYVVFGKGMNLCFHFLR